MAFDAESCMKLVSGVAVAELVVCLAVQHWGDQCTLCIPTAGRHDPSWGTYTALYIQGGAAALMAWMAPGGDRVLTNAFRASFGLEAAACVSAGLSHQFFSAQDFAWKNLLLLSFLGISYAGFLRVFVATVSAKNAGHLRRLPGQRDLIWVFGILAGVFTAVLLVAIYQETRLPDWMLTVAKQVITAVALVLIGVFADQFKWAMGIAVTYGAAVAVDYVELKPIIYSTSVNNTALFHSILMLYLVCCFGLLNVLMRSQTMFSQLSSANDSFSHQVNGSFPLKGQNLPGQGGDRGCCDCGGLRRK